MKFPFSRLSFNAGLLVKEMQKRGILVNVIGNTSVVKAQKGKHKELLYDIYTSLLSYPLGWMISDKYYSKKWLEQANLNVIPGFFFGFDQVTEATKYANKIGYPVVLKPPSGSHGDNVWVNIKNDKELEEIINSIDKTAFGSAVFIIEKYISGNEYRLFITKNNFFAAVWRIPASIIGDEKNNILNLVKKENYRRMNPRNNCLCEIKLDQITFDYMEKNNLTLDDVPQKGEKIYLRQNSNVSTGGNCYDVTDNVNGKFIDLAKKILEALKGVSYIGIDLICDDIAGNNGKYYICELNPAPGLSLHMMPEKGKSRNAAGALVDLLFPETIL